MSAVLSGGFKAIILNSVSLFYNTGPGQKEVNLTLVIFERNELKEMPQNIFSDSLTVVPVRWLATVVSNFATKPIVLRRRV